MERQYKGVHFTLGELAKIQLLQEVGYTETEAYETEIIAKQQMLDYQQRTYESTGDRLAGLLVTQLKEELGM